MEKYKLRLGIFFIFYVTDEQSVFFSSAVEQATITERIRESRGGMSFTISRPTKGQFLNNRLKIGRIRLTGMLGGYLWGPKAKTKEE